MSARLAEYDNAERELSRVLPRVEQIIPIPFTPQLDITSPRVALEQSPIVDQMLMSKRGHVHTPSLDQPLSGPDLQGQSAVSLLQEYATMVLAREKSEWEMLMHKNQKILFAIPGPGTEHIFIALERHARQKDAVFHYYRNEAGDLARGGTLRALLANAANSISDSHTGGRNLNNHVASEERNQVSVTSFVADHLLAAAGASKAIELRRKRGMTGWRRFNDPESIVFAYVGDAGMAQGQAKEAVDQMMMHGGAGMVLTIVDNNYGISTGHRDGAPGGNLMKAFRGYEGEDLKILEVDATNLQDLFDKAREAVEFARIQRKPVIFHAYNVPRLEGHSSSDPKDGQKKYRFPSELEEMEKQDPIPLFEKYLVDHDVASIEELQQIRDLAKTRVFEVGKEVLEEAKPDPADLYRGVYPGPFRYGPAKLDEMDAEDETVDRLQSSQEYGVKYILDRGDYQKGEEKDEISMRQSINITIAEEMRRDPNIVVFGQDVADFTTDVWEDLERFFEEKLDAFQKKSLKGKKEPFNIDEISRMRVTLAEVKAGRGYGVKKEDFAMLAAVLEGKGGVMKTTQFLQMLFGRDRVWDSTLAEASILGTAAGYALTGLTPVVEMQFKPYEVVGRSQLENQIANMYWRSNGQFDCGMVIRIQGMSRLGGAGGPGHGGAGIADYLKIPGLRVVMPAHADEAGPLMREAIRLARVHRQPVIFLEPINLINASHGFYQGPDTHIPLGKAEVRQEGDDDSFVVLTWSNNLAEVEKAALEWAKRGIKPTIINMRSLGVETDWETIIPYIKKYGKVVIFEGERATASAGANLSAQIGEHLFDYLDAKVARLSARDIRTPAGDPNEKFVLPQSGKVYERGARLKKY